MSNHRVRTRLKFLRTFLIAFTFSSSFAHADKLDDFKEAVNREGVTCGANLMRDLRSKLERERTSLEALKNKRRDLDEKRARAADDSERARLTSDIEAVDNDIEASKKRVEDLVSELEKRKDLVEKTIYTLGKCLDYRRAVMNIFAYAADKVRGESDPDIKPYAEKLRDRYPQHISGHEIQITNKSNALESCKEELR